ncbi:hypothetical protein [Sulfurospirillum sp. 1612]|uniref:hypothetical protein n=1 Tax=Sulfurospirillum sp. 1612 TaxID=3094835 RepID=UPI002F944AC3
MIIIDKDKIKIKELLLFKKQVKEALNNSDLVAIRCLKANIPFPDDWVSYVMTLRALLKSDTVQDIPAHPDYPIGS